MGLIPWFIAQSDRKTRSAVVAFWIVHELKIALRTAATIREGAIARGNPLAFMSEGRRSAPPHAVKERISLVRIGEGQFRDVRMAPSLRLRTELREI